jgi:hypothetical protein
MVNLTRERSQGLHRVSVWPPKTSVRLFRALRELGDEIKEHNPDLVSFLIVGSRTKGLGKARRVDPNSPYKPSPSDVDVIAVVKGTKQPFPQIWNLLHDKFRSIQPKAENPVRPQLVDIITEDSLNNLDLNADNAWKVASLFQLSTHNEIRSIREQMVQKCLSRPDFWEQVRELYQWHNEAYSNRAKFGLPEIEKMPEWLKRFDSKPARHVS